MTKLATKLQGNALVFSNSGSLENALSLEDFVKCPRMFEYKNLRNLTAGSRAALDFGSAVHAGLEARYRIGVDWLTPGQTDSVVAAAHATLSKANLPLDDHRSNPDYLTNLLRLYIATYPEEPFRVHDINGPCVERAFAHPLGYITGHRHPHLPDPLLIIWSGRIDLIVQWSDGSLSTVDHKTSSMGGDYYFTEYKNSQPQLGYSWALREQLNTNVDSFVINALFCRKPKKDGSVNFEFARQRIHISNGKIDEWQQNTLAIIANVVEQDRQSYYPMSMSSCVHRYGQCAFLDYVCAAEPSGRESTLGSHLFTPRHAD